MQQSGNNKDLTLNCSGFRLRKKKENYKRVRNSLTRTTILIKCWKSFRLLPFGIAFIAFNVYFERQPKRNISTLKQRQKHFEKVERKILILPLLSPPFSLFFYVLLNFTHKNANFIAHGKKLAATLLEETFNFYIESIYSLK